MIKECCVCRKREDKGRWGNDFGADEQHKVSHGYCPHCFAELMDRLDGFFLRRVRKQVYTVSGTVQR